MYNWLASDLDSACEWLLRKEFPHLDPHTGAWFVARHSDVSAALCDARFGARSSRHSTNNLRPAELERVAVLENHFSRWLAFSDAETQHVLRRAFRRVFTGMNRDVAVPEQLALLARDLVPRRLAGLDLVGAFVRPFTVTAVVAVLGAHPADGPVLEEHGARLLDYLSLIRFDGDVVDAARAAHDRLARYFERDYLADASGPVADGLRAARTDGTATPDLFAVFTQLLTGGNDPTVTVLTAVIERCCRPGGLDEFRADPETVVDEVVCETTPFHFASRATTAAARVGGCVIPADARVSLVLSAANRDAGDNGAPRLPHLAFGLGRHRCLGAHLATRIVLAGARAFIDVHGDTFPLHSERSYIRTAGMTRAHRLVVRPFAPPVRTSGEEQS